MRLREERGIKIMHGYVQSVTTDNLSQNVAYWCLGCCNLMQALYETGGRKFAFLRLCPLGCLPAFRAVNSMNPESGGGGCFEAASALALAHNNAVKSVLNSLQYMLKDFKYCNSNFYGWLLERIEDPSKYGMHVFFIYLKSVNINLLVVSWS